MPKAPLEALKVKSIWYDQYADHWYEYPRGVKVDNEIPGIWIRGNEITDAGFVIGDKLETEVSPGKITIRPRTGK